MASATIVRIKAENLSVLLFRYVYQTMTRNADDSEGIPCSVTLGTSDDRAENPPNAVAIEFGTNLNWRSITVTHMWVASTGIEGKFAIVGALMNEVANATVNLVNARVPKYAANIVFPELIAYILKRHRVSLSGGDKTHDVVPQRNEYV